MRNVEDAHPVRLQPLNQGEQRVLLAPTQRRGGLVQDQHLGVEGNRSGDLHHLPFANTSGAQDGALPAGWNPKNLAAQMAAVHMTTMTFARRLAHVDNILQQDGAERAFNKLARTFAVQVEALKRYRTGGEQKVTVQHVTVNEGGQAIVGSVSPQVGAMGDAGKS